MSHIMKRTLSGFASDQSVKDELEYMTEDELAHFIEANDDLQLTQQEVEYLFLRRRRLSIDRAMKQGILPDAKPPGVSQLVRASCPYKVIVLGNEDLSGKMQLLHRFCSNQTVQTHVRNKQLGSLPFEIQRHTIILGDAAASQLVREEREEDSAIVELWAPFCTKEFKALRPQYFPATDAFVVVISIEDSGAFNEIRSTWDKEIKEFFATCDHRDVPVILVGSHAERRSEPARTNLIQSGDAVQLARELGYFKYIEIQSANAGHALEVFRQTALSVRTARAKNQRGMRRTDFDREFEREDAVLRRFLQVPAPSGRFHYDTRRFELQQQPGVTYLYSVDGSDPDLDSPRYEEILQLRRPYPPVIKVVGLARCKYRSPITSFPVPEESEPPCGHFDLIGCRLLLDPRPSSPDRPSSYLYSTNGTRPSPQSGSVCPPSGIPLSQLLGEARTLSPLLASGSIRQSFHGSFKGSSPDGEATISGPVVSVVAYEHGKFISKTVHFPLPATLPPPIVRYKIKDHLFVVEDAQLFPNVEYRYTLDGTEPTCHAKLYSGAINVNPARVRSLKVQAFPKVILPSAIVELQLDDRPEDQQRWDSGGGGTNHRMPAKTGRSLSAGRERPPSAVPATSVHAPPLRDISPTFRASNSMANPRPFNPFPTPSIPVRNRRGIRGPLTREQTAILQARRQNSVTQSLKGSPQQYHPPSDRPHSSPPQRQSGSTITAANFSSKENRESRERIHTERTSFQDFAPSSHELSREGGPVSSPGGEYPLSSRGDAHRDGHHRGGTSHSNLRSLLSSG